VDEEMARLDRAHTKLDKDVERLLGRLSNPKYRDKAPAEVVAKAEQELEALRAQQAEIEAAMQRLKVLK